MRALQKAAHVFKRLSTEIAIICAAMSASFVLGAALLMHTSAIPATSAAALAAVLVYLPVRLFVASRIARALAEVGGALTRAADGEHTEVRVKGRNEIAGLASSFNRLSGEIAAREQRYAHMSLHDPETGLPNLRALDKHLGEMRAANDPAAIFAAVIGIDRFQQVRTALGPALATRLIGEIGRRVADTYSELSVGRMAAGTIAIIFRAESHEAAMRTAAAVTALASKPAQLGDSRVDVTVSAGLACDANDGDVHLTLIERADMALSQARSGNRRIMPFDRESYGDPANALSLMDAMVLGLSRDEFFLAYQPKYDLRQERVVSVEALLRWRHPQGGLQSPTALIALAEKTGHIRQLSDWVIDRAIADQRRMREAGRKFVVSVNVSGRMIADEHFIERALRQIRRAEARLAFEITEAAVMNARGPAFEMMKRLRDANIDIAIDDHGSGPSSLSSLRTIPAQELKIDRPFIQNLKSGGADALLVRSAIDLAHSLGMSVTAEGVETAETMALLKSMGADAVQGYLIAHPMTLDEFLTFDIARQIIPRAAPALRGLA